MAIDPTLLEILVCPVTKQPVSRLESSRLETLNQLIAEGEVSNLSGEAVASPLQEALITRPGTTVYPVEQGIPIMLEGEGIDVENLAGF